jgi:8-oxo-dGTP pyrophosphatase MutT (NUDIX family)
MYYLGGGQPPLRYVSSVRAVVFLDSSVLVVTEEHGHMYILPGGRVEQAETPLETLRREVLEETGWTLLRAESLGFMHFHHLGPRPNDYEYPYPDFIWPIYLAEARDFVADAVVPDDYVFESHFRPIEEVAQLPLGKGPLLLLDAALKLR